MSEKEEREGENLRSDLHNHTEGQAFKISRPYDYVNRDENLTDVIFSLKLSHCATLPGRGYLFNH